MTWAALLGKWTEFAQSAVALPREDEGGRLREAVPAIIALQAVTHALAELHDLEPEERALGLDRAEILIRQHAGELNRIWRGFEIPEAVRELVDDARLALRAAAEGGWEWTAAAESLMAPHPATLAELLVSHGFTGDLFVPTPGVPLFEGSPAAFVRGVQESDELFELVEAAVGDFLREAEGPAFQPIARQVYRQFDFAKGGPVRDVVRPMDAALTPGQPLLVPAILAGEVRPVTLPIPGADRQEPLPVVFEDADGAG